MSDLSDEAQAILSAGRELDNPTSAARERARRAVLARIAGAGAAAALSTSAAAAALPAAKILVPAILVLASGVGGGLWWHAAHQAPAHRPATATATAVAAAPAKRDPPAAPVAMEAAAATAAPTSAIEPTAPAPLVPGPSPRPHRGPLNRSRAGIAARQVPAAAPPGDNLQDETALLAQVNAALRTGDTHRGLVLLDEYDRRFPSGALREETAATRIIARCQAASAGAGEAARRFIEQHPRSPLSSRVRSTCLIKPLR